MNLSLEELRMITASPAVNAVHFVPKQQHQGPSSRNEATVDAIMNKVPTMCFLRAFNTAEIASHLRIQYRDTVECVALFREGETVGKVEFPSVPVEGTSSPQHANPDNDFISGMVRSLISEHVDSGTLGVVNHLQNMEQLTRLTSRDKQLTLVFFFAPWSDHCRLIAPKLQHLARTYLDVMVAKINVESVKDAAEWFHIRALPTFVLFTDAREVARQEDCVSEKQIAAMLDDAADEAATKAIMRTTSMSKFRARSHAPSSDSHHFKGPETLEELVAAVSSAKEEFGMVVFLSSNDPSCCKLPALSDLNSAFPNVKVVYVDTSDAHPLVTEIFSVEHMPTFVIVDKQGSELDRLEGTLQSDAALPKFIGDTFKRRERVLLQPSFKTEVHHQVQDQRSGGGGGVGSSSTSSSDGDGDEDSLTLAALFQSAGSSKQHFTLVLFYAEWVDKSLDLLDTSDKLCSSKDFKDRVQLICVDGVDCKEIIDFFEVKAIPAALLIVGTEQVEVARLDFVECADDIERMLRKEAPPQDPSAHGFVTPSPQHQSPPRKLNYLEHAQRQQQQRQQQPHGGAARTPAIGAGVPGFPLQYPQPVGVFRNVRPHMYDYRQLQHHRRPPPLMQPLAANVLQQQQHLQAPSNRMAVLSPTVRPVAIAPRAEQPDQEHGKTVDRTAEVKQRFQALIHTTTLAVVFYSDNSVESHMLGVAWERAVRRYMPSGVCFAKIDMEQAAEMVEAQGIHRAPAFGYYRKGETLDKFEGINARLMESYIQFHGP